MSFYLLSEDKKAQALTEFGSLVVTDPQSGDQLFERFGPGNDLHSIERPFERFSDYESLLKILYEADAEKYRLIHKGTPFYFLAWCAFDMRNYETAVFYMDAAVSEDMRVDPAGWINRPASKFLTLADDRQVAERVKNEIVKALQVQLDRFNAISGLTTITRPELMEFVGKVLEEDFKDPPNRSKRSIVGAFYTLLMEYEYRSNEIVLRNQARGSVAPFVGHLFKGALIFESLLKHFYPTRRDGTPTEVLGHLFHDTDCLNDFGLTAFQTGSGSLRAIYDRIGNAANPNGRQIAFEVTSLIRNTTAHNLVWDDIFENITPYSALFEQQLNAIFHVMAVKFLNL